jgi:phospholipid N-methyltransferase
MNENIQFLQAFLKNPLKVGAVAPSSPDLAWQMLEGITPDADNIIIELGVGTGAITKYVREILPDSESYLGIELDGRLVSSINTRYPEMNVVKGNACDLSAIYHMSGLGKASYILCCLPFVTLPEEVAAKVLAEIDKYMAVSFARSSTPTVITRRLRSVCESLCATVMASQSAASSSPKTSRRHIRLAGRHCESAENYNVSKHEAFGKITRLGFWLKHFPSITV